MNRPDKKNAITRAMYATMSAALAEGDADPAIRVHVFLGVPGAFSSGNDLADFMAVAIGGEGGTEVWDFLLALARSAKADGLGRRRHRGRHRHDAQSALRPDLRHAAHRVPHALRRSRPGAGGRLQPARARRCSAASRPSRCLASAKAFRPNARKDAGLIYAVVEEDGLEAAVLAAAGQIAAKPPEALKIARDLMRGSRDDLVARIGEEGAHFRERLKSDEARAALMAFMIAQEGLSSREPRLLRIKPRLVPAAVCVAAEHDAVVQPERPVVPELDRLRHDAEARPVLRPRDLADRIAAPCIRQRPFPARSGFPAAATASRPRRRCGCRAAASRNRRRPPRR